MEIFVEMRFPMFFSDLKCLFCILCFFHLSFLSSLQSGQPGTYILRQLYATVGQVQFVLPHIYPSVQYEVYSQEPQLTVEPLSGLNLLHDRDKGKAFSFLGQLQVFLLYLQDEVE